MVRDFAIFMIDSYLFPSTESRQSLFKMDFLKIMECCNYILIKPFEMRKKYTEYVLTHKQ